MRGLGLNTTCSGGKRPPVFFGTIGKILYICMDFPGGSDSKGSICNAGDMGSVPGLEEGMAAHSSILAWKISVGRGAWQAIVHGIAKSQTRLSIYIR